MLKNLFKAPEAEKALADLKAQLEAAQSDAAEVKTALEAANTVNAAHLAKITEFQTAVADRDTQIAALKAEVESTKAQVSALAAEKAAKVLAQVGIKDPVAPPAADEMPDQPEKKTLTAREAWSKQFPRKS